ncbi:hypothetical protein Nepgr_025572 [Nepenthes gracilis]|uniref:Proline-rich protein PRCC n=1 Tax=Nepenthes gracilis TaxID=150966 RepID=A0AAD3Y175_NEPGR|nr:hypothetical protein Nepgr_025572 [Nepenthes gracilis]
MDSLMVNYASSDDEEGEQHKLKPEEPTIESFQNPESSSLFSSLPKAQSSSASYLFSSLPKPRSSSASSLFPSHSPSSYSTSTSTFSAYKPLEEEEEEEEDEKHEEPMNEESNSIAKPPILFSSLPRPKSHTDSEPIANLSFADRNTKRVIQFRPPITQSSSKHYDHDDDGDDEEERKRKKPPEVAQSTSVKSFLSSIPAPKNSTTLGALPSSGSGPRMILEEERPTSKPDGLENELDADSNIGSSLGSSIEGSSSYYFGAAEGESGARASGGHSMNGGQMDQVYASFESYGNYTNYGDYMGHENYASYEGNWDNGSSNTVVPETFGTAETVVRMSGKRGKNQLPTEIVEVKQDELMKNRPREDQAKLTGIAFGPSYQSSSNKMKPSKLHKRKHQIGSLYYDMRQKEMELAERRAKGFLTKAETQAKYGW